MGNSRGRLAKQAQDQDWIGLTKVKDRDWMGLTAALDTASLRQINAQSEYKRTPLHWACDDHAPLEVIQLLIEKGANVNALDEFQLTPLHYACSTTVLRPEVVRLLIEHGANVNAVTKEQRSPIHFACSSKGPLEVIEFLVERGADVNAVHAFGNTPLHYACLYEAPLEVIQFLIEKGANVNAVRQDQYTPLLSACEMQAHPEVIRLLLEGGADATLRTEDGKSVWDFEQRTEVINLIEKHLQSRRTIQSSKEFPPFFDELFSQADIFDLDIQQDYAAKMLKERITTANKVALLTAEDLRSIGIALGDAASMLHAAKRRVDDSST